MSSRALKIMSLVQNVEDKSESYELEEHTDPWVDFKKWKELRSCENSSMYEKGKVVHKSIEKSENQSSSHSSTVISPSWDSDYVPISDEGDSEKSYVSKQSKSINGQKGTDLSVLQTLEETANQLHCENTSSHSTTLISPSRDSYYELKTNDDHDKELIQNEEKQLINERNVSKNQVTKSHRVETVQPMLRSGHQIEISYRKSRIWNKKDRCVYCNKDVTNFSRHLIRKHKSEESVGRILSLPKGDKQRKLFINLLRKQGNYSVYSENVLRPVQRPSSTAIDPDLTFLPCIYCQGLYRQKSLQRHATKCFFNTDASNSNKRFASEGQTMLAFTESRRSFLHRLRLKDEVFSKMHADEISFAGKSDPIVCQYAEDYLRKHKRPHIKSAVSNKIREMGRLLIALKSMYNITSVLEAFKPEHFDKIVSAVRIIAGYNESEKKFKAPSLALHFRTILLTVASTALTMILKKHPIIAVNDYDKAGKDIKNFNKLVDRNWKYEMGSLALKDLNEKHSLCPQKLPVTEDIIQFNRHCYEVAEKAYRLLKENLQSVAAFKHLSETILALTISLNRKRVGDVQYIKLTAYNSTRIVSDCFSLLTESEKEITKNFKRIMTIGKGSKAVPILFPKKIQQYLEFLLKCRDNFVPKENPFLFALVGSSTQWIDGSNILKKIAKSSGINNPETITSSRLRKQIATVLQILSLDDIEMEQLASFMGHTKKTHEEFYRLPQEVFQTSKIAKLLLMLMEKGVSKEDQGKTIAEIDYVLSSLKEKNGKEDHETNISGQGTEDNDISGPSTSKQSKKQNYELSYESNTTENKKTSSHKDDSSEDVNQGDLSNVEENQHQPSVILKNQQRNVLKKRGSWTIKHKNLMLKHFKHHIKNKISPKKEEVMKFKNQYQELFDEKTWIQIKVFVFNTYRIATTA